MYQNYHRSWTWRCHSGDSVYWIYPIYRFCGNDIHIGETFIEKITQCEWLIELSTLTPKLILQHLFNFCQFWVIGVDASSSISLQPILIKLRCFFRTPTTSFLQDRSYEKKSKGDVLEHFEIGCDPDDHTLSYHERNIWISCEWRCTWRTSERPTEGCVPNGPAVLPQLRRLQAGTWEQVHSDDTR